MINGPPGFLWIWGIWLFIFRELGSTGNYFQYKNKYIHILQADGQGGGGGGGGGAIAPQSQRNVKKEAFTFYIINYTYQVRRSSCNYVVLDSCCGVWWHAPPDFFFIKVVQSGPICVFQNTLLSTKKS